MAREMSTEIPPRRASRLRNLWGSLAQRWPQRLRLGRPRLTRLRLAVLGVIAIVVVLWVAVAVSSTSIYSAQVLVVDSGGIGIPPPLETLDFGDVPPSASVTRSIQFENNGRVPTAVMILEWGSIRDLMGISDAFFVLDPGDEKVVTFEVKPPLSALGQSDEEKGYSGRVIVVRLPWWTPW